MSFSGLQKTPQVGHSRTTGKVDPKATFPVAQFRASIDLRK
jgi:hypothetical protein